MTDLEDMDTSLEELVKDFNEQMEVLGSDTAAFHHSLIFLTAKYPEHKELLEFIVFINDKLETKQTIFIDIVSGSFKEMIKHKKLLLKKMIREKDKNDKDKEKELGFWGLTIKNVTNIKDTKVALMYLSIIVAISGALIAPGAIISILKAIALTF